ncbi:MAG: McrC family protein [Clostridia bacterium]|nr:McrC family protein [Clostridia bacterium]
MKKVYQIKEFGSFVCDKNIPGYISLPEKTFSALEEFILTNQGNEADPLELMRISAHKGIGKIITAKNYVGIISMKDGTTIEILPKIYSENDSDEGGLRTKKLLVNMIKTLRNTPYKTLQTSNVNIEKMNIFEIFIRMFIDEMFFVVKRGLKRNYELVEENATFFKGKIKFSEHIKINYSHKEHNYIEYDSFTVNRSENKILKSTLLYLYTQSASSKNRNDIKILLDFFMDVEASSNYQSDFAKCIPNRNMKDYYTALLWCKVFLMGKSFTSFTGSEVAVALLFPMETLFESYIAALLKKELSNKGYVVSAQDRKYHLFDEPDKKFLMKPDIVIINKTDKSTFIIDTKWKVLSDKKSNYGISQADMYQMYAYQKKYSAVDVTLLYPKTNNIEINRQIEFSSDDGAIVKVKFIDLFDIEKLSQIF